MPSFAERLDAQIKNRRTPALVGLDPRWDSLPDTIRSRAAGQSGTIQERTAHAYEAFCKDVIDVVVPLVPAVKPQVAFFEQLGPAGMQVLKVVMQYARQNGLIVIADAKRGDIGTTATAYAHAWLAGEDTDSAAWSADALTVNPYLGCDTLQPFIDVATDRNAGIYVLVRTSNPGAADFQDLTHDDKPVFRAVADRIESISASMSGDYGYGSVGAVVGATWPDELQALRAAMPSVPLLIPGYGAQGGSSADTAAAFDHNGLGAIVNSSRGINFAFRRAPYSEQFSPDRWQDAVAAATRDMIADLAGNTPAGRLSADD
jgi:orotidine-5'-phosphate decarboxylase